ncbi:MAG: ABC transporter permease [Clostridia bacterium]|nr:ABC transporter permease [Clostridia bacterium]
MNNVKKRKDPLVRISKRDVPVWWKSLIIRVVAIALALVVCAGLIVLVSDYNPLEVFKTMIEGNFKTERKIWNLVQNTAILLCISLAVTPAFKMKYWNLGAEGQALIGALSTAAGMIYLGDKLPQPVLIIVMFVMSVVSGMIWAVIPAIFKAKFNTNESLFTLMMNYVATQLVLFCITFWENPKGSNTVGIINMTTEGGWLPALFDQKYLVNILIVTAITVIMYIYLKYSKHGYEISVVGESENTARYIGINVKKVIIRTVLVSGAVCGITGFLLVSGTHHTITADTVGGQGFTAIMVSWLAKFNPFVMAGVSILITFLSRGAGEIATILRLNQSVAEIMTGIILFFIIGSEFFINYKVNFRSGKKEGNK